MNAVRTDQREIRLFGLPSPVDSIHGRVEIDPPGLNRFREPMRGGSAGLEGVVDATPIFLLLVAGLVVGRGAHENQPDAVAVKTLREHAHVFDVAVDGGGAPHALKLELASDLRGYLGEDAIADTVRPPAWRASVVAGHERAACHAERRQ